MFERTEARFARMAEQEDAQLAEIARLRAVNAKLVEALERVVAVVPDPPLVSMGYDSPPEHRTMEEHEIGAALFYARAALAAAKEGK